MEIATALGLSAAEAAPSVATSASCYDQIEYVRILSIVKSELKLIQIKWKIGFADFVIATHDAALEQRPERFNRIGVRSSYYILALAVPDYAVIVIASEQAIAAVLIGRKQLDAGPIRDVANETIERGRVGILDHLADHVALTRDRADDWNLSLGARQIERAPLAGVHVVRFPANKRFIHFHVAKQLREIVFHRGSDARAHIPRGFVRAGSHHAMNLVGADSLLGVAHDEHDLKPRSQGILCVLEDRLCDDAETIAVPTATVLALANPMEGTMRDMKHFHVAATRAFDHAIGPTLLKQKALAIVFGLKCGQQLIERLHANNIASGACGVNKRIIPMRKGIEFKAEDGILLRGRRR
jgi:hypothetical protein